MRARTAFCFIAGENSGEIYFQNDGKEAVRFYPVRKPRHLCRGAINREYQLLVKVGSKPHLSNGVYLDRSKDHWRVFRVSQAHHVSRDRTLGLFLNDLGVIPKLA